LKNETRVTDTSISKLKRIYHISDIQIRNLKRHKEFELVFEKLYEEIRKQPEDSVVYIGGDIAHSKTEMSPELVDQLSRLFKNLSDIVPTIIIAGNHDCNLNNQHRLDVLTPIVENLNHPNLHYFKDSGVYKFADVSFVVWDVWDKEEDYLRAENVEGDTKVLLYHGTVDQSLTDLGFKLPSKVKMESMDGYDMVLLGDIHKMQTLQEYDKSGGKPIIRYCGSLVQQNYGEALLGHGISVWDVESRSFEHKELPNDYGHITIDVVDGKIVTDDWATLVPKKGRLRLRSKNTTDTELKKVLSIIKNDNPKLSESKIYKVDSIITDNSTGNKISIGDVSNVDYQNELILNYVKDEYYVDDSTELKIKEINDELNQILPEEDVQRNINWKIKKFEFDNMFSYGENNVVDFTELNGIIGVFAPNASGKSAMLDALSFCLFDNCSRAYKAEMVLNNKKDRFRCKLNIEIDGIDYYIERKGKKQRNGHVKVDVNFTRWDKSLNQMISMNGDQRRTTNNNIKNVIGNYDDFLLTTLSSQNNSGIFLDKTQKEKKELLAQFMGIGVFDKLWQLASEKVKEESAILKSFQKSNFEDELTTTMSLIDSEKIKLKDFTNQLQKIEEEKGDEESKRFKLVSELKPIDDVKDIEELNENLEDVKLKTKSLADEFSNTEERIEEVENEIKKNQVNITKPDLSELENEKRNLLNYEKLILTLESEIQVEQGAIDKLQSWKWNEDCDACTTNPFVKDAKNAIESIQLHKEQRTEYLSDIEKIKGKVNSLELKEDEYNALTKIVENLNVKLQKLSNNKEVIIEKAKSLKQNKKYILEDIDKFERQKKSIVHNRIVEKKIEECDTEISILESGIKEYAGKKYDADKNIAVLDSKRKGLLKSISEMEELEDKVGAYQYYLSAVSRDGVPYKLIQDALPTIEGEVNNILSQIVDFGIIFEMDGKTINNHIVYDDDNIWPLELSSGMERFISSLALRVGLINVCNLPRGNFLAIDEGFGSMDSDNLNSIYNFFQYLKTQFQFVVIVSHIEQMRDTVDTLLEIKKQSGYSSINFGFS